MVLLALEAVSGLKINLSETSIFYINATSSIETLGDMLGCKTERYLTTYLGLPLGSKLKNNDI